jgi:hypothetical protein
MYGEEASKAIISHERMERIDHSISDPKQYDSHVWDWRQHEVKGRVEEHTRHVEEGNQ